MYNSQSKSGISIFCTQSFNLADNIVLQVLTSGGGITQYACISDSVLVSELYGARYKYIKANIRYAKYQKILALCKFNYRTFQGLFMLSFKEQNFHNFM